MWRGGASLRRTTSWRGFVRMHPIGHVQTATVTVSNGRGERGVVDEGVAMCDSLYIRMYVRISSFTANKCHCGDTPCLPVPACCTPTSCPAPCPAPSLHTILGRSCLEAQVSLAILKRDWICSNAL